ncbi:MAG TPA: hypothetical protein VKB19_02265 [Pedobacter sp.]|nr:hypothetical protein [Pedobacter sp.]
MKSIIPFFLMLSALSAFAKDISPTEKELLKGYQRIGEWYEYQHAHPTEYYADSLIKANENFQKMLLRITKSQFSLSAEFKMLQDSGMYITSSEDGLFRIYSWDTQTGGTMHVFYTVYQYKSGDKIFSRAVRGEHFDAGKFYSKIYTHWNNSKVYYLAISNSIFSTKDCLQEINVFSISNDMLDSKTELIRTSRGMTHRLRVDYDLFSVIDRPERPVELITYNRETKVIQLALVNEDLQVTKKFIRYKFTGEYFERQ